MDGSTNQIWIMKRKKDFMMRTDKDFKDLVKEIKMEKLRNKTAKELLPDSRVTKMFTRVPGAKDFIIRSKLLEDK